MDDDAGLKFVRPGYVLVVCLSSGRQAQGDRVHKGGRLK